MLTHRPHPLGRNRGIEGQVAGLVTRMEAEFVNCHVVDSPETSRITARHVIPEKSDDTLGVVALVEMDRQRQGHRAHDPFYRRALARTSARSTTGKSAGAVEDDKVPSSQR